jgi:hypothetical protein
LVTKVCSANRLFGHFAMEPQPEYVQVNVQATERLANQVVPTAAACRVWLDEQANFKQLLELPAVERGRRATADEALLGH